MTRTLDLDALAQELESERVERKESFSSKDKICQAICAFANDLPGTGEPGVVFVGLRDNGSPSGIHVTDQLLLEIGAIRSDGAILPIPSMSVEKRTIQGRDVAVIIVEPSFDPPVRYKGIVWVRVGPRRSRASRDDERRLNERRRSSDLPFDLRPLRGTSLTDLDLDRFRREYLPSAVSPDVLKENDRPVDQQLESIHLTTGGVPNPTAILMLGIEPRFWLPGAYVQFTRYDGEDRAAPVRDAKELTGPVPDVIRQLDELFRLSIPVSIDFTSGTREVQRPEYPMAALQQIGRNALLHRNYEDTSAPVGISWFSGRIEIESPGGLYGRVTPENFGRSNDYRNPTLAAALKTLGYVQRFGAGIPTAQRALQQNNNPPAEFQLESGGVTAIVKAALSS